jgi:MFS transporter, SP family, general alpha glucoside:H+ symporter
VTGYTTYFFKQAGLSTSDAFKFNIGNNATSFVGTMLAWPLLFYFGRRTVFMGGLSVMTVLYFAIGFAGIPSIKDTSANWARSSLLVIYLFVYCPTVGATVYPIVGESGSTRLRGKTVALARNFYSLISIVSGVLVPYMLSPTAWNWSAKAGFFFGGIACLCLIWVYFRLPEMKGRTYEELDILFERRISARKFKSEHVDAYSDYNQLVGEKTAAGAE